MRTYNIPVFIPHEGCPHDCTFCNQRKITGLETSVTPAGARQIISEYLDYLPQGERRVEAAFFGGSFTGLPLQLQQQFYDAANQYGDQIHGIRLSTRPDYITSEILELAKKNGVTMIELGAQSTSDEVLRQNNRGHTFAQTCQAVKLIKEAGIGLGLQMMTGMFGSTPKIDIETVCALTELAPNCVRIYPTLVLRDTKLETLYCSGAYRPQELEDAIETAKEILLLFRQKKIPVIRLGLHGSEELREPGIVVAGPIHPAFGELVESRIWRDRIEAKIRSSGGVAEVLEIQVPRSEVSQAIGHKQCNRQYFKEKYHIDIKCKEMRT